MSGRTCYQSFDKITDDSYDKFIKMIIARKHYAVLEHGQIIIKTPSFIANMMKNLSNDEDRKYIIMSNSGDGYLISGNVRAWVEFFDKLKITDKGNDVYPTLIRAFRAKYSVLFGDEKVDVVVYPGMVNFVDCNSLSKEDFQIHFRPTVKITADRGFLAEITRHREASFAVESTRYCAYNQDKFGNEITVIEPFFYVQENARHVLWHDTCLTLEKAYFSLLSMGSSPQEARSVLPNSLKTEIVMTANIYEWKHVFDLRCDQAAHPQMREIMLPLRDSFNVLLGKKFI